MTGETPVLLWAERENDVPRRVKVDVPVPVEKRTFRQEAEEREGRVELFRMENEVRELARKHGASPEAADALVQKARVTFRLVNGQVCPLAADGGAQIAALGRAL